MNFVEPHADVPGGNGTAPAAFHPDALVLVVDDDPVVRSSLGRLLRAEGLGVIEAGDGADALAAVARSQPDLVLMDVVMPRMSGMEVCRILKEDPGTCLVPILLLTGRGDAQSRLLGLEIGADDFLTKPPERAELIARVKSLLRMKHHTDQLVTAEAVVMSLGRSVEAKDHHTEGHCERLARYGTRLGARLGLDRKTLDALSQAGYLHDIGKVAVPDTILLKPGPLTEDEWRVMKRHPLLGEHICEPIHTFRVVLPVIRHHHEKGDGSGYPDGLTADQIPIAARVLQTVDVYDALVSHRPYKPPLPYARALAIMGEEVDRGWWDRTCVETFATMVRAEPSAFEAAGRTGVPVAPVPLNRSIP